MSKHTRGPWIAYETQIVKARVEIEQSHGTMKTNEYPIAAVNANLPEQEALANARLIAAAPELLEACQDALETLVQMLSADPDYAENNERLGMPDPLEDKLERAIAKATE
jgi:hypothetical protein